MQITNNNTTVQLNEQKILNMICDTRIDKLERVFKQHYQVRVITDLPEFKFYMFLYLCIVVLSLKAYEIADIYSVSINEIREGTKKVFEKQNTDKKFYTKLYELYIDYLRNNKQLKTT